MKWFCVTSQVEGQRRKSEEYSLLQINKTTLFEKYFGNILCTLLLQEFLLLNRATSVLSTAELIWIGWHDAEGGVFSERRSFKVVLQWNEWYASDPVLQPDLDQLQLHEEPLVSHWPLCHHRMSRKTRATHEDTHAKYCFSGLKEANTYSRTATSSISSLALRTLPPLQTRAPRGPPPPSCLLVWVEHILDPLDHTPFALKHSRPCYHCNTCTHNRVSSFSEPLSNLQSSNSVKVGSPTCHSWQLPQSPVKLKHSEPWSKVVFQQRKTTYWLHCRENWGLMAN